VFGRRLLIWNAVRNFPDDRSPRFLPDQNVLARKKSPGVKPGLLRLTLREN
jgi:hypothetical protein